MSVFLNGDAVPPAVPVQFELARKRELGAFYTPINVAQILCDWAIRSADEKILEPSFGGCSFLEASVRRLEKLDPQASYNIFGCDIDPCAFGSLKDKVPQLRAENFLLCDFLKLHPEQLPEGGMDSVIGNPPYVRYSKLDSIQKLQIKLWEKQNEIKLSRRSSLWVYFSFHALNFLKPGARMAWVLPVSLLTAQYAEELRQRFFSRFERLAFFTLTERIFLSEGTEERALIVLADGFRLESGRAHITSSYVDNIGELDLAISRWDEKSVNLSECAGTRNFGVVTNAIAHTLDKLRTQTHVSFLGDNCSVGIGLVTGDSKFFVKSKSDWKDLNISDCYLQYIAPRSRYLEGLSIEKKDEARHRDANIACMALNAPVKPRASAVVNYLNTYNPARRISNSTFAKRKHWHVFLEGRKPQAFLVFMTHNGPRVVLNSAGADSTNGLYRVEFNNPNRDQHKLLAISLLTTYSQLEAERIGRPRGSGALKLEPSDCKNIPVYLPPKSAEEIHVAFDLVDGALRSGNDSLARELADDFLLTNAPLFSEVVQSLREALNIARKRRIRNKGLVHE